MSEETPKAAAAFQAYCELGSHRSLVKLSQSDQKYTKSIPVLKRWSSSHNWQERVKQYDAGQTEERRRKHEVAIEEMNARHTELAMKAQQTAVTQITALIAAESFGSQASVQLLKLAIDTERLARGAPTERSEVKTEVDVTGFKDLLMQRLAQLEGSE